MYRPRTDTELLADALRREPMTRGGRLLDLGTGSGAVAVAARCGVRITAVDISRRAVATAWLNGMLHRRLIRVRKGDLLEAVQGDLFDVVVSNPPYVPSPDLPTRGPVRAWDAGPSERLRLDRICAEAPAVLEPELEADIAFGLAASALVDDRLGTHLLGCWERSQSSLRKPLSDAPARRI